MPDWLVSLVVYDMVRVGCERIFNGHKVLSTRAKKNVDENDVKVHCIVLLFDLLYMNGTYYICCILLCAAISFPSSPLLLPVFPSTDRHRLQLPPFCCVFSRMHALELRRSLHIFNLHLPCTKRAPILLHHVLTPVSCPSCSPAHHAGV